LIELRAIGGAEIHTGSAIITPSQQIAFAVTLYLMLAEGKPVSRARLTRLFWENAPATTRLHRLRQTLYQLKRLGIEVEATRDTVRLASSFIGADLERVVDLSLSIQGFSLKLEFLPGYDPRVSTAFSEWLEAARDRAHAGIIKTLTPKLDQARTSGDWNTVDKLSQSCLSLDPYNESVVLARAEAFAMRGQKLAAISLLDTYVSDVAPRNPILTLPAAVLRKRVAEHIPQSGVSRFTAHEPNCVGRQEEMSLLTRFVFDARAGHGNACLIKGEPGIGKTRLSSELTKFAELQGVGVQRVSCKKSDSNQPLSAFVSLVPRLREMRGALGVSHQSLSCLKRLTDFDPSEDPGRMLGEDSVTLYTSLRSAIFDLIDAVAEERCVVIVVDDIQWLDPTSATLFGALLEWISARKLFLLLSSRTHTSLDDYSLPGRLSIVNLKPLNDDDSLAVITDVIGPATKECGKDDLDWLIQTGEGNPYFLQELTKHWVEAGKRQEAPPSVAAILDERISRLTTVGRQLLQATAVLGEHSNLERIERLLEYPPHDLLSGLEELSAAGMIRLATRLDASHQTLQVRHDLVATQAVRGLTPLSLAFLHRRCGLLLEREVLGPAISISLLRACAFHWRQAGDAARAYELAIKCATHLLEIGLPADATDAMEGVLALCSTIDQQLDVLERIVKAQRMARDCAGLLDTISRIRALKDVRPGMEEHDDLEIAEFEARRTIEGAIEPLFLRTLKCIYGPNLDASHRVCAAAVALKLATSLANLSEIERIYLEVKPFLSDPHVDNRARLQVQVIYHTMCGDLREGVRFARERITLERAAGTVLQLSNAMSDLAFAMRRGGPEDEIPAILEEAYDIAIGRKLFVSARDYADRLAAFLIDTGRQGYERWLMRARESHGEAIEVHSLFSAKMYAVRVALLQGRVDEAEQIFNEAIPWDWLKDRHSWRAAAVALQLRLHIAGKVDPPDLVSDIEELQRLYDSTSRLGGQDYEVSSLCAGLLYSGDDATARKYFTDYVSNKRRDLTPYSSDLGAIYDTLLHSEEDVGAR
jgi:DNA-binding SARP family transcriptional activator